MNSPYFIASEKKYGSEDAAPEVQQSIGLKAPQLRSLKEILPSLTQLRHRPLVDLWYCSAIS